MQPSLRALAAICRLGLHVWTQLRNKSYPLVNRQIAGCLLVFWPLCLPLLAAWVVLGDTCLSTMKCCMGKSRVPERPAVCAVLLDNPYRKVGSNRGAVDGHPFSLVLRGVLGKNLSPTEHFVLALQRFSVPYVVILWIVSLASQALPIITGGVGAVGFVSVATYLYRLVRCCALQHCASMAPRRALHTAGVLQMPQQPGPAAALQCDFVGAVDASTSDVIVDAHAVVVVPGAEPATLLQQTGREVAARAVHEMDVGDALSGQHVGHRLSDQLPQAQQHSQVRSAVSSRCLHTSSTLTHIFLCVTGYHPACAAAAVQDPAAQPGNARASPARAVTVAAAPTGATT